MSKDEKIDQLFKQSMHTKQKCIEQGFQSLYQIEDSITQSIQNGGKIE
tara:strand:+ start:305 stop:448 length:144 start_codon:yes stop_codon:yes gene_type:complete